jgi:hypothetical protein
MVAQAARVIPGSALPLTAGSASAEPLLWQPLPDPATICGGLVSIPMHNIHPVPAGASGQK